MLVIGTVVMRNLGGETCQFGNGFSLRQVLDRFHVGLRVSRSGRRMGCWVTVRPDHLVRRPNWLRRPDLAAGREGEGRGKEQGQDARALPLNPPGGSAS